MPPAAILYVHLRSLLLAVLLLCPASFSVAADSGPDARPGEPLRIGVLAFRGQERARAEWQGHANFLSQKLAPYRFTIVPLTLAEFGPAVAARRIDRVITNTGHYVELETGGSISRIATMRIAGPRGPVDRFGGVAFARRRPHRSENLC